MYLLYCIFKGSEIPSQTTLPGVGGQPVFPIEVNGLSAAISEINDGHLAPDIARVMTYKKIVESFHKDHTVIPMRYGCVLKDRHQVIQLLKKNAKQYESLLHELDGCVEMGIRVMIETGKAWTMDSRLSTADPNLNGSTSDNRPPAACISGKAYLAARKDHYEHEDLITEAKNKIAEQLRTALTGLYVKCKIEIPSIFNCESTINNQQSTIANPKTPMLSLYFLVPRKTVDPFRLVFHDMYRRIENSKLLLNGPWPPYSFVLSDDEQSRPGLEGEEIKEGTPGQ